MMKTLRFLILFSVQAVLLSLSCIAVSYANPPKFVYRFDTRPPDGPDGVFAKGFSAWGNNKDAIAHLSGASCQSGGGRNSAFIATSSARSWTINNAIPRVLELQRENPLQTARVYIYTIRATPNMYEARRTADTFISNHPGVARDRLIAPVLDNQITLQQEYIVLGDIPNTQVQSFVEYRWVPSAQRINGRLPEQPGSSNGSYIDANTSANESPFTDFHRPLSEEIRLHFTGRVAPALTACFPINSSRSV